MSNKTLVIVESPSKAKTISKYLGKEYLVTASGGHIRDLPRSNLGVNVDNDFTPIYITVDGKESTVKKIRSTANGVEKILLATDPDREGEAISWHLMHLLDMNEDEISRIVFNEISKKAITKAINEPRKIDINLVNAQQARRILDRLVGYKISPLLAKKVQKGLSAGRVQSVALKIIVEREKEIKAFIPEDYWMVVLQANKTGNKQKYNFAFQDFNGKTMARILDEKINDKVVLSTKTRKLLIDKVTRAQTTTKPNPPFTTSTMQQDAVNKLSFSASRAMSVAQRLYEGFDIKGMGHLALVTYIRTDSIRISNDAKLEAKKYIQNNFGSSYVSKNISHSKKGGVQAQDAHEAIRPISLDITPELIEHSVDRDSFRLYKLIYNRFIASQMANAEYDTLNVHLAAISQDIDDQFGFSIKGRTVRFDGFTRVYDTETKKKKETSTEVIDNFKEGEILEYNSIKSEKKQTKPPARYTDSSLVKKLEESGIGRPSTYATIMSVLNKRDYTYKEKKQIVPTDLGMIVSDKLDEYFVEVMDIKFTSRLEQELDDIADGKLDWIKFLKNFYPTFEKELKTAERELKSIVIPSNITEYKCPDCGCNMVIKTSKYGQFLGCEAYPNCNKIMSYGRVVLEDCPLCHRAPVVTKRSKNKKTYYQCADGKKCKFITWELPISEVCQLCKSPQTEIKSKITGDKLVVCTSDKCERFHKDDRGYKK